MRKVLLLNASYEVIDVISWQKALTLVFKGRARAEDHHDNLHIRTVKKRYKLPSVVVLLKYIFLPHRKGITLNKKNLYLRDKGKCQYCDRKLSKNEATIDHVVPQKYGGKSKWENVVLSCGKCNSKKGHKTLKQAGLELKKKPEKPKKNSFYLI